MAGTKGFAEYCAREEDIQNLEDTLELARAEAKDLREFMAGCLFPSPEDAARLEDIRADFRVVALEVLRRRNATPRERAQIGA